MKDVTTLFLQILVFGALFGAAQRAYLGFRWTWGLSLQFVMVSAIAAYGAWFAGDDTKETWAWIGWGLFFAITILPSRLTTLITRQMHVLDARGAQETAARLGLFYWGPLGRFWRDLTLIMRLDLEGNHDEARALTSRYQGPDVPRRFRESLQAFVFNDRIVAGDWAGILSTLEGPLADPTHTFSLPAGTAACRAYLELGDLATAVSILAHTKLISARHTAAHYAVIALPFYALAGARAPLDAALTCSGLPPFATKSWQARCLAAQGRTAEGQALLAEAIALVPEDNQRFRERLTTLSGQLPDAHLLAHEPGTAVEIAEVELIFSLATATNDQLAISRPGWPTWVVGILLVLSHGVIVAMAWGHGEAIAPWADSWLRQGSLIGERVRQGEGWRLLTYMFLHAGELHLGANLLGLAWLAPRCEKVFGLGGAQAVFWLGGVGGGLAHVLFGGPQWAMGASGAVMALLGAAVVGLIRGRGLLPAKLWKRHVAFMVLLVVVQVAVDLSAPVIAFWVHLGGLFTGGIMGLFLPRRTSLQAHLGRLGLKQ